MNKLFLRDEEKGKVRAGGFTLVELSIVLIITGILVVPLLQLYTSYLQNEKMILTKSRIDRVASSLGSDDVVRYPCPADMSLPITDANYGRDVCMVTGFSLAAIPDCSTLGLEQGICKAAGARDTDADADGTVGNGKEVVLIGAAPQKHGNGTLISGIVSEDVYDAWGGRLVYAVSFTSADPNRLEGFSRFKNGVIRVIDEWGNDTDGTISDAHFVLYSHGPDGAGAYLISGGTRNCNLGNDDGENCDGDSTFRNSIGHYEGAKRYDDYIFVQNEQSGTLWKVEGNPATSHILAVPGGAVGIKDDNPGDAPPGGVDVRLDVGGTIRADTVRTQELCRQDGTNCMSLDDANSFFGSKKTIGAVKNSCANGEVISSIGNSQVSCGKADVQFTGVAVKCPVTTWVSRILTDGKIICSNGVTCPGGAGCL